MKKLVIITSFCLAALIGKAQTNGGVTGSGQNSGAGGTTGRSDTKGGQTGNKQSKEVVDEAQKKTKSFIPGTPVGTGGAGADNMSGSRKGSSLENATGDKPLIEANDAVGVSNDATTQNAGNANNGQGTNGQAGMGNNGQNSGMPQSNGNTSGAVNSANSNRHYSGAGTGTRSKKVTGNRSKSGTTGSRSKTTSGNRGHRS